MQLLAGAFKSSLASDLCGLFPSGGGWRGVECESVLPSSADSFHVFFLSVSFLCSLPRVHSKCSFHLFFLRVLVLVPFEAFSYAEALSRIEPTIK